jgi:hypothetical protein
MKNTTAMLNFGIWETQVQKILQFYTITHLDAHLLENKLEMQVAFTAVFSTAVCSSIQLLIWMPIY